VGSRHWDVRGADGARWFVTVDELAHKRVSESESLADGFGRLQDSLLTAVALRDAGLEFVAAPAPGAGGEPASRFGGRFAVSVYPFTDGQRALLEIAALVRVDGLATTAPDNPQAYARGAARLVAHGYQRPRQPELLR
jgi:hypothetical protein